MLRHQKMHLDEIEIHDGTVQTLIREQFPQFGHFPIHRVGSTGTVNAIYKVGTDYYARLPLLTWGEQALGKECDILPFLAKHVSLSIPSVIGIGKPGAGYPLHWAIYQWIDGEPCHHLSHGEMDTAKVLAGFITELHAIPVPNGAPKAGRRPLRELDEITVTAITECGDGIDGKRTLKAWRELLDAKPWDGNPAWIHADLLKPNLLLNNEKLTAVIDFGSAGVGDPAFDIIPAWAVLTAKGRPLFRETLNMDEDTWLRAKAYALHQAALIIPYYRDTNPSFVKQAIDTIQNILWPV